MNPQGRRALLRPSSIFYPFKKYSHFQKIGEAMFSTDKTIRPATLADSAVILPHRRRMFEDMKEGSAQDLDRMAEATAAWLDRALADGSYGGWLAETAERKVVSGGGILV